jgi:hypothetical protein
MKLNLMKNICHSAVEPFQGSIFRGIHHTLHTMRGYSCLTTPWSDEDVNPARFNAGKRIPK